MFSHLTGDGPREHAKSEETFLSFRDEETLPSDLRQFGASRMQEVKVSSFLRPIGCSQKNQYRQMLIAITQVVGLVRSLQRAKVQMSFRARIVAPSWRNHF